MPQDLLVATVTTLQSSFSTCFDFMFSTLYWGSQILHLTPCSAERPLERDQKKKVPLFLSCSPGASPPIHELLWPALICRGCGAPLVCGWSQAGSDILKAGGETPVFKVS